MIDTKPTIADSVRAGRAIPLEDRQARWDRIQAWGKLYSLAEIRELELKESGNLLTRERIRKIKDGARPGSVGRPRLKGLQTKRRDISARLRQWRTKDTDNGREQVANLTAQLAAVDTAIAVERRRQKSVKR